MGGSPKVAVDNIKEVLNINQKRKDYLGEPPSPPHLCCPAGGPGPTARGSSILAVFLSRPQSVLFCMKAAECHTEE